VQRPAVQRLLVQRLLVQRLVLQRLLVQRLAVQRGVVKPPGALLRTVQRPRVLLSALSPPVPVPAPEEMQVVTFPPPARRAPAWRPAPAARARRGRRPAR
jgi:hypothetical protein